MKKRTTRFISILCGFIYVCIALFELLLYGSPNVIMGLFRENLTLSMDSGGSGDPYLSFGRKSFNGRESQKN